MRSLVKFAFLVCIAAGLAGGCATVKRATGQLDDSVLPGQRENVLPPEQQTARDPGVTGKKADTLDGGAGNCLPEEPNCIPQGGAEEQ